MWKTALGSGIGVAIPIGVEYFGKVRKVFDNKIKLSGLLGVGIGAVGLGVSAYNKMTGKPSMAAEDREALTALGGSSLATGLAIIILDELRKRKLYEFRRTTSTGRLPTGLEEKPLTIKESEVAGEPLLVEV